MRDQETLAEELSLTGTACVLYILTPRFAKLLINNHVIPIYQSKEISVFHCRDSSSVAGRTSLNQNYHRSQAAVIKPSHRSNRSRILALRSRLAKCEHFEAAPVDQLQP